MANNFFTLCSLFYSIMLNIIYFKRKNIGSMETKTYSAIVLTNLINVIFAVLCYFTISNKNIIPIVNDFVSKTLLLLFITWELFFTAYIVIITRKEEDKIIKRTISKSKWYFILFYIILSIIIYFLPLDYYSNNKVVYSYGMSANFVYVLTAILIISWIILVAKNKDILKSKKCIPIILFVVLTIIVVIIQKSNPGLLLITATETFITVIMFFTIENPDIKLLDEVHRAKEITDNANEEKTMFLYNMTNEIREITRDINYSTDEILNETDNKKIDVEVINDSAREIKKSTAKFTTMTNEILDIDTIDSASIKIYNDKYNIKLIIKELVKIYTNKCKEKNISFRVSIASDIPEYLYGDGVGVKQAINIILDNSIKNTTEGYIELNINAIIKGDIARLVITVEDSSIGMTADEINKIFLKKKNKDEESLNLSNTLYNAKALVTLMNGTIIPSSIYGKGTKIKIVLDQKVGESSDNLIKYESIYDKKRILLVDDNISTEKIINKLLKDTNIEVDYVSLGKEALDKIRNKEKYNLILLDEIMDPLDGLTVMKKFKDIRAFKTNVILLTRNSEYEYNEEYLKYGFKDYLLKPINKDSLLKIIDKYLK